LDKIILGGITARNSFGVLILLENSTVMVHDNAGGVCVWGGVGRYTTDCLILFSEFILFYFIFDLSLHVSLFLLLPKNPGVCVFACSCSI